MCLHIEERHLCYINISVCTVNDCTDYPQTSFLFVSWCFKLLFKMLRLVRSLFLLNQYQCGIVLQYFLFKYIYIFNYSSYSKCNFQEQLCACVCTLYFLHCTECPHKYRNTSDFFTLQGHFLVPMIKMAYKSYRIKCVDNVRIQNIKSLQYKNYVNGKYP